MKFSFPPTRLQIFGRNLTAEVQHVNETVQCEVTLFQELKRARDEKRRVEDQLQSMSSLSRLLQRQLEDVREQFDTESSFVVCYL